MVEIDWQPKSKHAPPPESAYMEWFTHMRDVSDEFGKPFAGIVRKFEGQLERAGYEVTSHRWEQLKPKEHCHEHSNRHQQNKLARLTRDLLVFPEVDHLEGLSMRLLTQRGELASGVRAMCARVVQEIREESFLPYHTMSVSGRTSERISC